MAFYEINMRISLFSIFLTLISLTCYAAPGSPVGNAGNTAVPSLDLGIQVQDGLVSMDVENADIALVLKQLALKANINILVGPGVKGRISISMSAVPIEKALKRLCQSRVLVFEYLPNEKAFRIISAGAYSQEKAGIERGPEGKAIRAGGEKPSESPRVNGQSPSAKTEKMYDSKGRLLYKTGEILVKFKKGVSEERIETLHKSLGSKIIGRIDRLRVQRIKLRNGLTAQEAIKRYYDSGIVELAERHALRYPEIVPNDTYFHQQWGLTKIHAPEAWNITHGNGQIIIAVIDSGVDYLHPDLAENIWINQAELNGVEGKDDDGNGYVDDIYGWDFAGNDELDSFDEDNDPMDVNGHGTHVAGIIAARGNNGLGIAGICWNASVMLLKVQADNSNTMDDWAVIEALLYALDNGASIVNCSFGGEAFEEIEYEAFASLKNAGILAVCAAGNDNVSTDEQPNYPSSYDLDNIISVAASDQDDRLASFSNYGASTVDLMAPGVDIESALPAAKYTEALDSSSFGIRSGTSMAAPHVTGVAGLILSEHPGLNYLAVKSAVLGTVDKIPSTEGKILSGGRVNALCALCSIDPLVGDLSCDHRIGLDDAILALQVASGLMPEIYCYSCISAATDLNGDEKIGLEEALYSLQVAARLR